MLHAISWSGFLQLLVIAIIGYYLLVLALYFKKEILALTRFQSRDANMSFSASSLNGKQTEQNILVNEKSEKSKDAQEFSSSPVEILLELKDLFQRAGRQDFGKPELIQGIRSVLKKDPELVRSKLREDINIHIIEEARLQCGVELLPGDIVQIWSRY